MITFVSEKKPIKNNMGLSEFADSLEDIISNPMSEGVVKTLNESFGQTECEDHPDSNLVITLRTKLFESGHAEFDFSFGPACCEKFKSKAEGLIRRVKFE